MKAENLVVNNGRQWQVVEKLGENLPHICITVLSKALVVEAVPEEILNFKLRLTPG